jgi:DNA polymerase
VSDPASFREYYLRRIGVATPLPPEWLQGETAPASSKAPAAATSSADPAAPPPQPCAASLEELARAAAACEACELARTRHHVVFGVGNPDADILFIGEAPGREEDLKGEPFVGRAGKLLDRMLAALELNRHEVYIMNVIKCRPPNNRDPLPEEVQACARWFEPQWDAVAPRVVCVLGRVAAQRVLNTDAPLAALRGRWHERRGTPVRVTYHPAFLLRSPAQKARAWEDLRALRRRLREIA